MIHGADMASHTPVIELSGVSFSYNGSRVLSSIDLTVGERDFLAVIGPNGGGKTTLLKLILGIHRPEQGTIRVLGASPRESARRIGYVPQDTSINREFPITVADVVGMGRLGSAGAGKNVVDDRKVVDTMLGRVDMLAFRDRRIGDLSGGQRQRVFIARALAAKPDILVLDEPTANVDIEGQTTIYSILRECNEHMTVVVASHDITGVLGYVGRMAYVNRTLHTHDAPEITPDLLQKLTGTPFEHLCPVEVISRMLGKHAADRDAATDIHGRDNRDG